MNKTELLFIRASKSLDPLTRIRSVYRRRYGNYDNRDSHILSIFTNICEKYNIISIGALLTALDPNNIWKYSSVDDGYQLQALKVLISHVRLSEIIKFEGYIAPLRFTEYNVHIA
jgi:hypothetical protein